jgi:pimeloyl-ACP methyl ester carboxylesterase
MPNSELVSAIDLCDRSYRDFSYSQPKTDTQFLVEEAYSKLYIAFRGSSSLKDWITNVRLIKAIIPFENTNPKIRVHLGFVCAYHSVRPVFLKYAALKAIPIVITGHSLGGAIATLAACDLQYQTGICPNLITFGAPKIGNEAWAVSVSKRIKEQYRFVNKFDPVPTLPPIFHHPGCARAYKIAAVNPHHVQVYRKIALQNNSIRISTI